MTHNELLKKMENLLLVDQNALIVYDALRAVIELHKPYAREDGLIICDFVCNDEGGYLQEYPCSTIEAIEKGLANGIYIQVTE